MTDAMRPSGPDLTCDEVRDMAAAFVLDAIDTDEAEAVRVHLASCPDAHDEIAELAMLASALPVLDEAVPVVEPPAGLKARIMAAAAADLQDRAARSGAAGASVAPTSVKAPPSVAAAPLPFPSAASRAARAPLRGSAFTGTWALRIAAVLAEKENQAKLEEARNKLEREQEAQQRRDALQQQAQLESDRRYGDSITARSIQQQTYEQQRSEREQRSEQQRAESDRRRQEQDALRQAEADKRKLRNLEYENNTNRPAVVVVPRR